MKSIETELFEAAWDEELAKLADLIERHPDLPRSSLGGALQTAAYNAKADAVELLLSAGADPNTVSEPTLETVLHQTITKTTGAPQRTRIVKSLIAHGADVNRATRPGVATQCFMRDIRTRGETALHRAAAYGDVEMVAALITAGADKSAKDVNGDSPITWGSWHLRESELLGQLIYGEIPGWHGFPNPNTEGKATQ